MSIYNNLLNKSEKLAVIGLGYVGLPIAVAFSRKDINVIGYDVNEKKIEMLKNNVDPTEEVGDGFLFNEHIRYTSNESELKNAKFYIVAVPTPINQDHTPNLKPVISACQVVGRSLKEKSIVVFESTVYPGVTEEICIPILEKESGLKCGIDFKVGYSPERINPGDKIHKLNNITKIVSGMDDESLEEIKNIYNIVVEVGTHPVSSIKTAEAIKVVENSQRDINIAFMNELAIVFDMMDINTQEVVEGMNTKWNSLGFTPGLVGGHCIGVDPYYFLYKAEELGYHSQIILSGRKVNDGMGKFIADSAVKQMILNGLAPKNSNVVIFGITFKENCNDIRNSKVEDIIKGLKSYNIEPLIVDPWADKELVKKEYKVELKDINEVEDSDCIIFAVSHEDFRNLKIEQIDKLYKSDSNNKLIIDVKSIFDKDKFKKNGYTYWSL